LQAEARDRSRRYRKARAAQHVPAREESEFFVRHCFVLSRRAVFMFGPLYSITQGGQSASVPTIAVCDGGHGANAPLLTLRTARDWCTPSLHKKSSYPPTGLASGEPDDRLQRVSSTPRLLGSIIGVSGILDHAMEPVIGRAFARPGGG
jgi:hypothetical protein